MLFSVLKKWSLFFIVYYILVLVNVCKLFLIINLIGFLDFSDILILIDLVI